MAKLIRAAKKKISKMERGQVLVLVALAAVVIIAIVGLVIDVGVLFIGNARLRRAVDSAALAAALQVREGYTLAELTDSATEFLLMNGITLDPAHPVVVETCDTDPSLCYDAIHDTTVPRKLVQVTASATIRLAFLPVIGIADAPTTATAISETASVDVVLVIDRSESMTNDAAVGDPMRDPNYCNDIESPEGNVGNCEPFNSVKNAAIDFVQQLFYPYDRVAIVTFAKDPSDPPVLHLADDCPSSSCTAQEIEDHIVETIRNLTVYSGDETISNPDDRVYPDGMPSRCYGGDCVQDQDPSDYRGMTCSQIFDDTDPNYPDPSPCTTTNIGKALQIAGNEFAQPPVRQQALWAVILLTDGMANAGYFNTDGTPAACPRDTWPDVAQKPIYCNDADSTTRHAAGTSEYDADDFAYDMADFVSKPASDGGQYALMFTIGLGDLVRSPNFVQSDGTYPGEVFLQYSADMGRGAYYFAPSGSQLREIFRKIAENIATRLTH